MKEIQPFFTTTLPLVLAIFLAAWLHNRHFDALSSQINEMMAILRDIQAQLRDLDRRVTRLEERSSPVVRG